MTMLSPWVVYGGAALVVMAVMVVVALGRRGPGSRPAGGDPGPRAVRLACTVCGERLAFLPRQLTPLTASECALVVRERPKMVGKELAEYTCPYCGAVHCFAAGGRRPEHIGTNLYTPQIASGRCAECHTPLRIPPWPRGTYDGRLEEVPMMAADFGLVCSRCQAVCCVRCCTRRAQAKKDVRYVCPRCARTQVDRLFYG